MHHCGLRREGWCRTGWSSAGGTVRSRERSESLLLEDTNRVSRSEHALLEAKGEGVHSSMTPIRVEAVWRTESDGKKKKKNEEMKDAKKEKNKESKSKDKKSSRQSRSGRASTEHKRCCAFGPTTTQQHF